ncbi:septation ring formation regulator EzrA [Paenisporosarcina sp. TG20]|uniref:septation ring formation regulator EzrA n=1 Tax=Paenisporosarcina sp. TG20 TaxID=1211706 RepID=UPI000305F21F|nr:septation ring formation regulator EzrA [Paenisporosarcina sp. TG20]
MKYIIIAIIVLIVLLVLGYMVRRKHTNEIERLENEKHQIQNKPILEEMTKVKQLNMNGQTEEMFESWRNSWTQVMDVHMPKIDSLLFDAEDCIDKFRFKQAKAIEQEIQIRIKETDEQMSLILVELDRLIGSEEKNRIEMDQLKEQYRAARKTLLAHLHSYGATAGPLEKKLEQFIPKFDEYDQLTDDGNYLQAREIVIGLNEDALYVFALLSDIPSLLTDVQNKIPASIYDLRNGQREMEEKSYYLEHLEMTEQLNVMEEELVIMKESIIQLEITNVKTQVEEMKDKIEMFYDMLEKEVMAKRFVDHKRQPTELRLVEVTSITRQTSDEAAHVQQSYRISEKEAEIPLVCLKQIETLQKRYDLLAQRASEDQLAYSSLQEELTLISTDLEVLYEEQNQFSNNLKSLRIDENRARAKLDELKRLLHKTDRMLQKANTPGIPEEMDVRLEEAEEHIYLVMQSLQEVPLNMKLVDTYLAKTDKCIQEVHTKSKEMLENVLLIERIIQYGNRYRASHPHISKRLDEAEVAFRQLRYSKALEDAAIAVEEIEPGAMKRIEVLVKEDIWRS